MNIRLSNHTKDYFGYAWYANNEFDKKDFENILGTFQLNDTSQEKLQSFKLTNKMMMFYVIIRNSTIKQKEGIVTSYTSYQFYLSNETIASTSTAEDASSETPLTLIIIAVVIGGLISSFCFAIIIYAIVKSMKRSKENAAKEALEKNQEEESLYQQNINRKESLRAKRKRNSLRNIAPELLRDDEIEDKLSQGSPYDHQKSILDKRSTKKLKTQKIKPQTTLNFEEEHQSKEFFKQYSVTRDHQDQTIEDVKGIIMADLYQQSSTQKKTTAPNSNEKPIFKDQLKHNKTHAQLRDKFRLSRPKVKSQEIVIDERINDFNLSTSEQPLQAEQDQSAQYHLNSSKSKDMVIVENQIPEENEEQEEDFQNTKGNPLQTTQGKEQNVQQTQDEETQHQQIQQSPEPAHANSVHSNNQISKQAEEPLQFELDVEVTSKNVVRNMLYGNKNGEEYEQDSSSYGYESIEAIEDY